MLNRLENCLRFTHSLGRQCYNDLAAVEDIHHIIHAIPRQMDGGADHEGALHLAPEAGEQGDRL